MFMTLVLMFWFAVMFIHTIFKSCMLPPYLNLLNKGLIVKTGYIQLQSTNWNRMLQKLANWKPVLQKHWFDAGVILTIVMIPLSTMALILTTKKMLVSLFNYGTETFSEKTGIFIMEPVIPGLNIPASEFPYYLITLLLCSIFHEMGHAFAAARENVKVQGIGVFLLGIFPGAFVDLPSDRVSLLSSWQQLRIFCAGVWHNLVLCLLSLAMLGTAPHIFSPFAVKENGITVLSVDTSSGVYGPTGLFTGDVIMSVSDCPTPNFMSLMNCIEQLSKNSLKGYCLSSTFIEQEKDFTEESNDNCCAKTSQSNICFHHLKISQKRSCFQARKVVSAYSRFCQKANDCPDSDVCSKPWLEGNMTRLLDFERQKGQKVLFLGPPEEILLAVSFTDYVSRLDLFPTRLIHIYETFFKYVLAFSGALALLNVIPCAYLDGKFILRSVLELFFKNSLRTTTKIRILSTIIWVGTSLIATMVCCGIISLYQIM